jgi:hypothetical protein
MFGLRVERPGRAARRGCSVPFRRGISAQDERVVSRVAPQIGWPNFLGLKRADLVVEGHARAEKSGSRRHCQPKETGPTTEMGSSITNWRLVNPEEVGSSGTNGCEKVVVMIGIRG